MGTLDPLATGVLPLCLGHATRIARFLEGSPKVYTGEIRLGFSTETYDREGRATSTEVAFSGGLADLQAAADQLTGNLEQTPPSFSAKKIGGVPSYKFARRGKPIATPAVPVKIETFEITEHVPPLARFRVVCSPGTYVRSLVHDVGALLGCGAHLNSLRRIRSGWFVEAQAVPPDKCSEADVISLDHLLEAWPRIEVEGNEEVRIGHGNPISGPAGSGQMARIFNKRGEFLAIGVLENGWVLPRVVLISTTSNAPQDRD